MLLRPFDKPHRIPLALTSREFEDLHGNVVPIIGTNWINISQSVARALSVLDLLGDSDVELGVREVAPAEDCAQHRQRLLSTLAASNYVEHGADGLKYRIGHRAFQIGQAYLSHTDLQAVSLPELRIMAERDRINAYLGVLRDGAVIYLAALQSHGPIAITSAPGSRGWLHSTAFGKARLAELADEEVARIVSPEPFHRLTKHTKTGLIAAGRIGGSASLPPMVASTSYDSRHWSSDTSVRLTEAEPFAKPARPPSPPPGRL